VNRLLDECSQAAARLVNGNIPAISRVANALLKSWELTWSKQRRMREKGRAYRRGGAAQGGATGGPAVAIVSLFPDRA